MKPAVTVEWEGERHRLSDLAVRYGVPTKVLWRRVRDGWELGRALSTPVGGSGDVVRELLRVGASTSAIMEATGMSAGAVYVARHRMLRGRK